MPEITVSDPLFWKRRLSLVERDDWKFLAIWYTTVEEWEEVLKIHGLILQKIFPQNISIKILDAGCGQGHLISILPKQPQIDYIGVDISPDFIELNKIQYPGHTFMIGDLKKLPFENQQFDYAVVRSVEGMVCDNLGYDQWKTMENELLRVAKKVILLNYTHPKIYRVTNLESIEENFTANISKYLSQQKHP